MSWFVRVTNLFLQVRKAAPRAETGILVFIDQETPSGGGG
jgi:hypothetical protein